MRSGLRVAGAAQPGLIELNEMLKERVSAHQILSAVTQYWESYRPNTYPILPVK